VDACCNEYVVSGRDAPPEARAPTRWLDRLRLAARVDLAPAHRQPSTVLVGVAAVVAAVVSLALDEVAVHLARSNFATTRHFSHFRFSDYATLTIVGVLVGAAAWPVVTRITSAPRWLFFRLAVVVTILLWIPDGWLLWRGETSKGVAVLMGLHLAIALVTYNVVVHLAPVRAAAPGELVREGPPGMTDRTVRRLWSAMAALIGLDLALGIVAIVTVPFRRPNALLPVRGVWEYDAHGAIGIALGAGALALLVLSPVAGRMARIGAVMGAVGIGVGLGGGVLATFQTTRLLAMGVMLLGAVLAAVGYLIPLLEAIGKAEAARAEAARHELARAESSPADAAGSNGKHD
jgi:hypothetical protein